MSNIEQGTPNGSTLLTILSLSKDYEAAETISNEVCCRCHGRRESRHEDRRDRRHEDRRESRHEGRRDRRHRHEDRHCGRQSSRLVCLRLDGHVRRHVGCRGWEASAWRGLLQR
jgi:hypothetical protein